MLARRTLMHLAAGAAALPITQRFARGQGYPTRSVHIYLGFPPGGVGDMTARMIATALQERLGQPFVVENRPGAGGNTGTEAAIRAPADGYTLTWVGTNNAINGTLYENLKFNFIRDVAGVAGVLRTPYVMAVHPAVPAATVAEFIAYAKSNPGKINMGSGGPGTGPHVNGELFKMLTGIDMVHVPYRGEAPAVADLVTGQVQVMFNNLPTAIAHIRAGLLRALAVTTAARSPALPDVPPLADSVPGYEASAWFGLGAPRATPAEIVAKLNREVNESLADPALLARIADVGGAPLLLAPAEFDALIVAETEKWGKVVRFSGAKVN